MSAPSAPQQPQLTDEQAFSNIRQACAAFSGTLNDHQAIQASLQHLAKRLEELLNPPAPVSEKGTPSS